MSKPKMNLTLRISVDSTQRKRFTEEEIKTQISYGNVSIGGSNGRILTRNTDGAVLGEILINDNSSDSTRQRKPNDKVLDDEAMWGDWHQEEHDRTLQEIHAFIYGGRFARDYDPWYYISNNEFPEESKNPDEEDLLIRNKYGTHFLGYCAKNKWGNLRIWRDREGDEEDITDEVICFMPIPEN